MKGRLEKKRRARDIGLSCGNAWMVSYAAAGRTPRLGAAATIVGLRSDAQERGVAGRATEVCEKPRCFLLNFNAFV